MKKNFLLVMALVSCAKVNNFKKQEKTLPLAAVVVGTVISSLQGCNAGANVKKQVVEEEKDGKKTTSTWRAKVGFGKKADAALDPSSGEEEDMERSRDLKEIKKLRKKLDKKVKSLTEGKGGGNISDSSESE